MNGAVAVKVLTVMRDESKLQVKGILVSDDEAKNLRREIAALNCAIKMLAGKK